MRKHPAAVMILRSEFGARDHRVMNGVCRGAALKILAGVRARTRNYS